MLTGGETGVRASSQQLRDTLGLLEACICCCCCCCLSATLPAMLTGRETGVRASSQQLRDTLGLLEACTCCCCCCCDGWWWLCCWWLCRLWCSTAAATLPDMLTGGGELA